MNFIKDITLTDISVCEKADTFLQSSMWGEFKSRFGWKSSAFLVEWEGQGNGQLLVLSRRIAPGFSFAYVPWGPELPQGFPEEFKPGAIAELSAKLKHFLARNTIFIRFDPPWFFSDNAEAREKIRESDKLFFTAGFKKAAASVQPPDTVIINLDLSCEEILSAMKSKWRYNISLSGKKGVQVKTAGITELESFYDLLKETAARDGIAIHSFDYYKTLFDICEKRSSETSLRLYTASHEGNTLAAIVVLFRLNYATYLYGASSGLKRNLMAPYALQWKAMQDAKEAGCRFFDLFGIPPDDNPNHPMAGLYLFKTGFGGEIIHRPGSRDYVYKPAFYSLFRTAEALLKKMRDFKKKR